jgi:putative AlgH/UPF0301 family transcriptional regulator
MSLRKLCLFMMLATSVALAAVGTLDILTKTFDGLASNSRPLDTTFAPAAPESHKARLANESSPTNIFLPVQFKDPKDLGLGKLLVASRDLADPIFAKTVILLVHYDAEGVVGLVVNRRTNLPLSRVFDRLKEAKDRKDPVYLGGPVEIPAVFALLRSNNKLEGTERIFGEVYLISTNPVFEKAISSRPDPGLFHVYLGYAGWTSDQLRKEVELGVWFIFPADTRAVFGTDPDSLWRKMIEKTEFRMAESEARTASQPRVGPAARFRLGSRPGDLGF